MYKKKVLLKVYPYFNLGDDLFLKIILERYSHVQFYLFADERYKKLTEQFPNLIVKRNRSSIIKRICFKLAGKISRSRYISSYLSVLKNLYHDVIARVDAIVCIGGSMFIESTDGNVDKSLLLYRYFTSTKKPLYFIGCNFGPYLTNEYKRSFKDIFCESEDLCFREEKSFNLFSGLPQARWNPDIVLGMPVLKSIKLKGSVGFVLVDPRRKIEGFDDFDLYIEKCIGLIKSHHKNGDSLFLFSFCQDEGDELIIDLIKTRLGEDEITDINVVRYRGEIEEFLQIYSNIEVMYCGRFHAMILSMLYDQYIIPISYSIKMNNTLNDLEFKGAINTIDEFVDLQLSDFLASTKGNSYNIKPFSTDAQNHFQKLDVLLEH